MGILKEEEKDVPLNVSAPNDDDLEEDEELEEELYKKTPDPNVAYQWKRHQTFKISSLENDNGTLSFSKELILKV